MSNTELIRELRALTQAGMKDCKESLEEAGWDLQKAVDIVKVKGLAIADGRTGRIASEGRLGIANNSPDDHNMGAMVEVNCQTDFVANSTDFIEFMQHTTVKLGQSVSNKTQFSIDMVEEKRKEVVSKTKENVVVRRWWVEESQDPTVKVFNYLHGSNIGVLLTIKAPTEAAALSEDFGKLSDDLTMQIAAMNPLSVSSDRLSADELDRQKTIFRTQLQDEKKPEKMWDKILEGKLNKWYKEVVLLEQESIVTAKTTIKQVLKNVGTKLGGEIQIVNFVRCQVGEGIEKKQDNLAEEVAKMM